jgi:hypothetical protein
MRGVSSETIDPDRVSDPLTALNLRWGCDFQLSRLSQLQIGPGTLGLSNQKTSSGASASMLNVLDSQLRHLVCDIVRLANGKCDDCQCRIFRCAGCELTTVRNE